MTADVIFADFKSRSWHKPQTLEQLAVELTEQFNRMAEEGTVVECIPYGGEGIDGMDFNARLAASHMDGRHDHLNALMNEGYVAPTKDPA